MILNASGEGPWSSRMRFSFSLNLDSSNRQSLSSFEIPGMSSGLAKARFSVPRPIFLRIAAISNSMRLVRLQVLILGYSRFSFRRASSILNCQSTPRCFAVVFFDHVPISDCRNSNSPMRRPCIHWLVIQLSSHSAMFSQLPCFGV